nr:hypothetical protein [Tanacetum cinerariifolium]GEY92611.1 hypothetical protein [Tanacetum cinerariifolium]
QQATINDKRVTLRVVQGRQILFATGTTRTYTPGVSRSNSRKQRTVICYNYKGEGHMSKKCTKTKRKRDDSWFKDKVLLVQAQANDQILHEEELAILVDQGITEGQATHTVITYSATYQANDLDAYESNCDEKNTTKVPLMENLSHFGSDVLIEVHNSNNLDNNMINQDHSPSCRPTKGEVPIELPKVNMVNTSLKKLKHHLAGFDMVIKERTTATSITKGSWGFEHTKACFRDENIPFVKALKDIFNTFDQYLINELTEVQNVFHQKEQGVEQHRLESKSAPNFDQYFELNELKAQLQEKDTIITKLKERLKSLSGNVNEDKVNKEKGLIIVALRDKLKKLKRKALVDSAVTTYNIASELLKIDVEPLAPRLLNNKTTHSNYLRLTQEQAAILREIDEHGKSQNPLNNSLDSACKYTK